MKKNFFILIYTLTAKFKTEKKIQKNNFLFNLISGNYFPFQLHRKALSLPSRNYYIFLTDSKVESHFRLEV